jgi:hypothetical protein
VIKNELSRGANDPAAFAVLMKGGEFFDLATTALKKFEEDYSGIKERRDIFSRQVALDTKIENSEVSTYIDKHTHTLIIICPYTPHHLLLRLLLRFFKGKTSGEG